MCDDYAVSSPDGLARMKKEEEMMNRPVNIDGIPLTVGDLFSNTYDAEKFVAALDLIAKVTGKTAGKMTEVEMLTGKGE